MTDALPYDVEAQHMGGSLRADRIDPKDFPPDLHHFYCRPCYEGHDHFMRVVLKPAESSRRVLPPRFNAYGRVHSTHACDHPVRYAELRTLAERYGAVQRWDKDANLPGYIFKTGQGFVDSAERTGKVVYASMYDPGLRALQSLSFNGHIQPLEESLYDDKSKDRLFMDAFEAACSGRDFYAAVLFRPIGNRGLWDTFTEHDAIPGQSGPLIKFEDIMLRPSSVLVCRNGTYRKARGLADRNGVFKSSAIMVVARAVVSLHNLSERIQRLRDGAQEPKAAHVNLIIEDSAQIHAWDHAVSFAQADAGKAIPPVIQRQHELVLR